MPVSPLEQSNLTRLVSIARPVMLFLALAIFSAAGMPSSAEFWLLAAYFLTALVGSFAPSSAIGPAFLGAQSSFRFPIWLDVLLLILMLLLTPVFAPLLFVLGFVSFAAAVSGASETSLKALVAGSVVAVAVRQVMQVGWSGMAIASMFLLIAGFAIVGAAAAFLGRAERRDREHRNFLEAVSSKLQFERGISESIRAVLSDLACEFHCEEARLAFMDEELERIFVWKVLTGTRAAAPVISNEASSGPETFPIVRADAFLLDCLEVTLAWSSFNDPGAGFGWDRRSGAPTSRPPRPPESLSKEFGAHALMAATVEEANGRPAGRVLLFNPREKFTASDLRWLERVVRHIGPQLDNLYRMRHVRARAVEAERSRISRDLHDGILQTLLSLKIQLEVLHRNVEPETKIAADVENLQKTVKEESEELRRLVTEMRPLRVESADLRELMMSFAERFQHESNLAVDLFIEDRDLRAPDRICREIFQIYRESLNNIKKHAHASHVVVKLGQDDAGMHLVVDDNGLGFSFSGQFSNEELDRLRLGPISIKERTRSVGGNLTVESNPGHGARVTVEIPLT
jgi:signal transduction histidine kinase